MVEMEEPVDCPGCKEILELSDTRTCQDCRALFCPDCLMMGFCDNCREEREGATDATDGPE